MRRCLVTGEVRPKVEMVRFVAGPDDRVVPDVLERLPGRGLWVTAERGAIETAVRKRAFSRGARRPLTAPDDLADTVEAVLARRVVDLVALARKAGEAVAGYEKVRAWLENGTAAVLVQAHDGSARGRAKLRPPGGPETEITFLAASELGLAFGRENVIHGALAGGGLTTRVVGEAARLNGLRAQHGGDPAAGKDTTTT